MKRANVAKRKIGFRNERGAALITVLMISVPLLMAGGSLILITSMNVANTADMAAETKAYYAAESGAQQVLRVMRGNVAPNPLFATNPTGSIATENMITFRKAVTQSSSNISGDANNPRLSRWLSYDSTYPDRVTLSANYTAINGLAFNVELNDPDNSNLVTFTTSGAFVNWGGNDSHMFSASGNQARLTYVAQAATTINTSGSSALGKFQVTDITGSTTLNAEPFKITISQSAPWAQTYTINCTLTGTITAANPTVVVNFPSLSNNLNGAVYLRSASAISTNNSTPIGITVTAPEPRRLIAKINGFGPRSAKKQLQFLLSRAGFDFSPVSAITLRSSDNGDAASVQVGSSSVYS